MKFNHSVPILYSADVARSIAYYIDVLGFESHWTWDDLPNFGGVSKNSVEIFFCRDGQGQPGTWLSIMLDNVDEYYETIKSKGAIIRVVPETKEWGLREMLVEDPDKHIIRFGQSAPPNKSKDEAPPRPFRLVHRKATSKEFEQLVAAVGWTASSNAAMRDPIIAAALFAVVAEDMATGDAIGYAQVVSDEASFYYVKDVMVHPNWQGKGVGTAVMKELVQWIDANAPYNALVGLYTGENLAPFYRQFGFKASYGMNYRVRNPPPDPPPTR